MNKIRCLIIDEMYPGLVELLSEIQVESKYEPNISRETLISEISKYEGLIVRSKTQIDRQILDNAKQLKFIARAGAGIDNIDQEVCREKNITVFNAPEANRDAVGEHTLGMLLCLYNKLNIADQEVRQGTWDREGNRGIEIQGKTVGIIGYGNMGSAFAKRLKGFDCNVIAFDKYKTNYGTDFVKEATLQELFEQTDILSLHVPLTEETNKMVNSDFFNNFMKNITLLNVARGKVVVLADLITMLNQEKVSAAALDVLENEKIGQLSTDEQSCFDDLKQRPNVLFTPHIAGWSFESYEKINTVLVSKIQAFLSSGL